MRRTAGSTRRHRLLILPPNSKVAMQLASCSPRRATAVCLLILCFLQLLHGGWACIRLPPDKSYRSLAAICASLCFVRASSSLENCLPLYIR